MYNVLIADDEPLIVKGLAQLLSSSGLDIGAVHTALSGYEALDYIRMEEIDLLITDIQMGSMSGIELMHQVKIVKPWVQTIIISAHETFQYAQTAIRLGARDYLIKPLKSGPFLDSVRQVLLSLEKPPAAARTQEEVLSALRERFRLPEPQPAATAFLNRLLADSAGARPEEGEALGIRLTGPYFAVVKLRPQSPVSAELQYAMLNVTSELLGPDWDHYAFYVPNGGIAVLLQWSEERYGDNGARKIDELDMIGRSLHHNIGKYLRIGCAVGISQILRGTEFIRDLGEQADRAIDWNRGHPDHHVFYYGDFKWRLHAPEPTEDEEAARIGGLVDKARAYIDEHYGQKGLTLHEVAQHIHVSPNYLSYLFKKGTGYNLWEYVIKLRMEESRRLLLQTDMRRYEIADRVGYESPEHFSKIFKKYFGFSPSELKK